MNLEKKVKIPYTVQGGNCAICKKKFRRKTQTQVTCSDMCSKIHRIQYSKMYYAKPENKQKRKEYMIKYNKKYYKIPGVKEDRAEYFRIRYKNKKDREKDERN